MPKKQKSQTGQNLAHPLQSLLQAHCPNGVEFKTLGELLQYEQPTQYIVKNTKYNDSYNTPVLTAGATFILGYTNETDGIYQASKEKPCIIFDDFTTSFHWVDFPFKVKSSAMKILTPVIASEQSERGNPNSKNNKIDCHDSAGAESRNDDYIQFRFIYYAMKCIYYFTSEHARQWISKYSQIKIPLPPLAVQEKIVEILDTFTELQKELQKELQARRKQYEYYRNKLLSFEELQKRTESIRGATRLVALGEIVSYIRGVTYNKSKEINNIENQHNCWKVLRANNITFKANVLNFDEIKFIDKSVKVNEKQHLKADDILICAGSGSKEHIGKVAFITKDLDYTFGGFMGVIRSQNDKLKSRFLFYILGGESFLKHLNKELNTSTINNLKSSIVNSFKIPLPPLPVQNEIVEILDKFDALVNDLTSGIPAEIQARKKQYEYYREQLLSFKEID